MAREIVDNEGVTWSCIQAFAGLGNDPDKAAAALVKGSGHLLPVTCTPSGGARSVRLELPRGWKESVPDREILDQIRLQLTEQAT